MKPTEKELEILQVLWQQGPCTVRQVNDILSQGRDIGYTTTLKFMQIMLEKGFLTRTKEGKTHIYQPVIAEDTMQKTVVNQVMDSMFKGSAMQLVMQVLGNHDSSKQELEQIQQYLNELKQKANE